jgi:hypothetical protein
MTIKSEICIVMIFRGYLGGIFAIVLAITSCVKEDSPLVLPPKTGSQIMQVFMGPKPYDTTVFVSLSNASVVRKFRSYDWDLRFDASENGLSILMNTGKNMRSYNTGKTAMHIVTDTIGQPAVWSFDVPNNLKDSAFLNSWHTNGLSKNEVYVLRAGDEDFTSEKFYKLQIVSADNSGYYIKWDTLKSVNTKTLFIPKNSSKNFVYCSFKDGGKVVDVEPNKTDWDISVTRYSVPFYGVTPFLFYPVNGVILNSFNTLASTDTMAPVNFATFTKEAAAQRTLIKNEDVIGYNWKTPTGPNFTFETKDKYIYTIKTQKNELYKLHFLDFYYQGIGGAPKFEFERLQ